MQDGLARNITLYRWARLLRNLIFWHAVWFIYFQNTLSAAEALLLYVLYDISTTVLEVPSGYMSDRLGRKRTLLASAAAGMAAMLLLATGASFTAFALGQILFGASMAFASGTDEALLYESLEAVGRAEEIERQEIIAWRYSFAGLAVAGISGGLMSLVDLRLPFLACAIAHAVLLFVTARFVEPPAPMAGRSMRAGWSALRVSARNPVLLWFFALALMTYTFSHLPFVFGQAFIEDRMALIGLGSEAPLVSGIVSSVMIVLSLLASLFLPWLRTSFGLTATILAALALQISLSGVIVLSDGLWVIGYLMLRMIPEGLYRPLTIARTQPLLTSANRATWVSLQSFVARLIFAGVLLWAAGQSGGQTPLSYPEIQAVLTWAVSFGLLGLTLLALTSRPLNIEPR